MSIEVVRAFVRLRNFLTSQKDIFKQISEIRSFVLKQSNKTDQEFKRIWEIIEKLSPDQDDHNNKIGFKLDK